MIPEVPWNFFFCKFCPIIYMARYSSS